MGYAALNLDWCDDARPWLETAQVTLSAVRDYSTLLRSAEQGFFGQAGVHCRFLLLCSLKLTAVRYSQKALLGACLHLHKLGSKLTEDQEFVECQLYIVSDDAAFNAAEPRLGRLASLEEKLRSFRAFRWFLPSRLPQPGLYLHAGRSGCLRCERVLPRG